MLKLTTEEFHLVDGTIGKRRRKVNWHQCIRRIGTLLGCIRCKHDRAIDQGIEHIIGIPACIANP